MGLCLDDDNEIIGDTAIAETPYPAAVALINMKAIEIAAKLHRRISLIDRLAAGTRCPNSRGLDGVGRDGKPLIDIKRLIHLQGGFDSL